MTIRITEVRENTFYILSFRRMYLPIEVSYRILRVRPLTYDQYGHLTFPLLRRLFRSKGEHKRPTDSTHRIGRMLCELKSTALEYI